MKTQNLFISVITVAIVLLPYPAFSQVRPDSRGDYYSWAVNWIVAVNSGSLNCRSGPGTNYSVITRFSRASYLTTFSELEGSPIRQDRQGRPWVRVKVDGTGSRECYVRANVSFIGSMDSFNSQQTACIESEIRRGLGFYDAAFNCVD